MTTFRSSLLAIGLVSCLMLSGCGGSTPAAPTLSREASLQRIAKMMMIGYDLSGSPAPQPRGKIEHPLNLQSRQPKLDEEPRPPQVGDRFDLSDLYYGVFTALELGSPSFDQPYSVIAYDVYLKGRGPHKVGHSLQTVKLNGEGKIAYRMETEVLEGATIGKYLMEYVQPDPNRAFIESQSQISEYKQVVNGRTYQNYERYKELPIPGQLNGKVHTYEESINGAWRRYQVMRLPSGRTDIAYTDDMGYDLNMNFESGDGAATLTSKLDPFTPATARWIGQDPKVITFADGTSRTFEFDRNNFWRDND